MANEHCGTTKTGSNKKKGIVRFSKGVVVLVIGIVCFLVTSYLGDGWGWLVFVASLIAIATGSLFVVLGIILFFVQNSEKRRRMNGIIPFWMGVVAIIISLVGMWLAYGAEEEGIGWLIILIPVIVTGVLFVVVGATLFFEGKSEAKN